MTADRGSLLAGVSELLGAMTGGPPPGGKITASTRLVRDLHLGTLDLANLTGRIQARYGLPADLTPFLAWREARSPGDMRVGELTGYLVRALAGEGQPAGGASPSPRPAPPGSPATAIPEAAAPPAACGIIISSGRCGSTLLSGLIGQEPETLSASESLGRVKQRLQRQPTAEITGARYWAILSDASKGYGPLLRLGIVPDEFRYPQNGRYADDIPGIPPILRVTLPALCDDPDALFDRLAAKVPGFPRQPVLRHHEMLLNLLTNITGRRRWVERSGASSLLARPLLTAFPHMRIVYLTRGLADTARSMSRHPAFQMGQVRQWFAARYGADPWTPAGRDALPAAREVPVQMRRLLPGLITREAMDEVMTGDVGRFEAVVAHMNGVVEQALADLTPRQLHRMRYEDLLARPLRELTRLGEFLGFADPATWAAQGAGQVRAPRRQSAQAV